MSKLTKGKRPWHSLVWPFLGFMADVAGHGDSKYEPGSWRNVENARDEYFSAAQRHLTAWYGGEDLDSGPKGSGKPHLAHVAVNAMILWALEHTRPRKPQK